MNYSFVLIGCGRIAECHAQQIKRLGKLVAVCDIDTQKAIDFAEKHKPSKRGRVFNTSYATYNYIITYLWRWKLFSTNTAIN